MSTIPISLTEKQFDEHVRPYITVAKRGYECKISLHKVFNYILYQLHTGCQWYQLLIDPDANDPDKKEISWHAVYYHFRKWSKDSSLERVWQGSIMTISAKLNLSELNLDGSHVLAKKGGEWGYPFTILCSSSPRLIYSATTPGLAVEFSKPRPCGTLDIRIRPGGALKKRLCLRTSCQIPSRSFLPYTSLLVPQLSKVVG